VVGNPGIVVGKVTRDLNEKRETENKNLEN